MNTFSVEMSEDHVHAAQEHLFTTLAIMQHHDAITGTHVKDVGVDYERLMENSTNNALKKSLKKYGTVGS